MPDAFAAKIYIIVVSVQVDDTMYNGAKKVESADLSFMTELDISIYGQMIKALFFY